RAVEDIVLTPRAAMTTELRFDQAMPLQVAQGAEVSDDDGARRATILIPPNTTAELVMPDGSTQPFSGGQLRITELTVGATGQAAMPAKLPRSSAYTWAAEFSFDEAEAAGAASVRFSAPVVQF